MKRIEILVLDSEGYVSDNIDFFATMKEAREWVKERGLDPDYWDRRAESKDWHKHNVDTIQLLVNGEVHQDWFPKWSQQP